MMRRWPPSYYHLSQEVQQFKDDLPEDIDIDLEEVNTFITRRVHDKRERGILYAGDRKDHFEAAKWLAEGRLC